MRAIFQWKLDRRVLELGRRTLIMGIVNVTPDSFSDGGLYIDAEKAVVRAEQLLDDGAAIIAVGGEATRTGTRARSRSQGGLGRRRAVGERIGEQRALGHPRGMRDVYLL